MGLVQMQLQKNAELEPTWLIPVHRRQLMEPFAPASLFVGLPLCCYMLVVFTLCARSMGLRMEWNAVVRFSSLLWRFPSIAQQMGILSDSFKPKKLGVSVLGFELIVPVVVCCGNGIRFVYVQQHGQLDAQKLNCRTFSFRCVFRP